MEQVGVQFLAAGGDVYITTVNNATKATNTFVDATEHGSGRVGAAGQVMIGALRQVGTIAVDAFGKALKATEEFIGKSIDVAGDFEAGMHKFQAVAGKGVDTKGLEKFKDLFISLGKELPVSTSEVEQAAIEMVSGGIDPAIVAGGALRQTIQFAAASGLSLADAAKTSAKFLAGWTDSAATAEQKVAFLALSTDTLTKAAAASSTTASELRLGLFNVQGAAQALGVSFEDTTATLALLAPAFESTSQAGTALNVFMTRLVPSTKPALAIMQDLGIVTADNRNLFFDSHGVFLGMANAAEILKTKMAGLTDEQKISQLHTLFGNDAMKVGNLLLQDGGAAIDAMKAKMDDANGVSATAALMQSGYNTALENAKGSVEALQITIGSALLPVLTDLMNNVVAPAVNTLTDFASALFGNNDAFLKLSPTMQDFVTTIDTVVMDMQNIIGAFDDAGAGSVEFAQTIGELVGDLGGPGDLIMEIVFALQDLGSYINAVVEDGDYLNDFLTDIPKPMQGVVQAAGEVVALFRSTSDESSALGSAVNDLSGIWDHASVVITNVMAGYQAIAQAVLPIVTKFVAEHGTEISAFFKTSYDSIISIVHLALDTYNAIVPPILKAIAGFIEEHSSEIQRILSGAWTVISNLITGTLDTIKGIFKVTLDILNGDWDKAWTDIKGIVDTQVKAAEGIITGFFNIIAGLFDTNMDTISKTWTDNWATLKDIVTNTDWAQVGQDVIDGIKKGIIDGWNTFTSWITGKMSSLVDTALAAIGAGSPATEFMPVGAYAIQGIMEGMQGVIPSLDALINQTGNEMIAALTKNIEEGGDKIRKELETLTNDIKAIAADISNAIADAFGATASVDRQKVANMKAVSELAESQQAGVQSQINAAEQIARAMNDPQQAAAYFKMRSQQLIELGKLSQQINAATDMQQRAMLQAQYDLINDAQNAEMKGFDASAAGRGSPIQEIADQLAALFSGSDVASKLPGILESPLVSQVFGLLDQLRNATVAPPASGYNGVGGTSNFSQTRTYNMPIYTNQSPDALAQSLAIQQAVMP